MRLSTLSIAVVLTLGAGSALAQSRTVSTANMPKPGVSYIAGPGAPERRETVSTGTLPTPARLYVGGQATTGGYDSSSSQVGGAYVDGGYYGGGGYDGGYPGAGGNYPGGYPGGGRPGGGHDGGHGHDHDHDGNGHGRPNPGNTVVVGGTSNPNRDNTRFNVAPVRDNNGRDQGRGGGNNGYGNGNNGYGNNGYGRGNNGVRPVVMEPPPRPYSPGSGQSSVPLYQQPGSGPPPQIPRGASTPQPTRGRGY
jgi:hypothetical protein